MKCKHEWSYNTGAASTLWCPLCGTLRTVYSWYDADGKLYPAGYKYYDRHPATIAKPDFPLHNHLRLANSLLLQARDVFLHGMDRHPVRPVLAAINEYFSESTP